MKIPTVAVVEKSDGSPGSDTVRTHPAYAVMSAHRYQGGHMQLYGSPLIHQGGVTVKISLSREHVSFSHSHYWEDHKAEGSATIVEVAMSEAQWAAFISTMNVGSGVPVTLQYAKTGKLERLPYIEDTSYEDKRADDIRRAMDKKQEAMTEALRYFDELLAGGSVKKGDLQKLRQMLYPCGDHLASNTEFAAKMLTEHAEKLTETAKAEVSAMVMRMVTQYPQLQGQGVEMPKQIEDKSDD